MTPTQLALFLLNWFFWHGPEVQCAYNLYSHLMYDVNYSAFTLAPYKSLSSNDIVFIELSRVLQEGSTIYTDLVLSALL
jgi:hypothetical protein